MTALKNMVQQARDRNTAEIHPLDDALGDIHEAAIWLAHQGMGDVAPRLAQAHETIQQYLIVAGESELTLADALEEAARIIEDMQATGLHQHSKQTAWLAKWNGETKGDGR